MMPSSFIVAVRFSSVFIDGVFSFSVAVAFSLVTFIVLSVSGFFLLIVKHLAGMKNDYKITLCITNIFCHFVIKLGRST